MNVIKIFFSIFTKHRKNFFHFPIVWKSFLCPFFWLALRGFLKNIIIWMKRFTMDYKVRKKNKIKTRILSLFKELRKLRWKEKSFLWRHKGRRIFARKRSFVSFSFTPPIKFRIIRPGILTFSPNFKRTINFISVIGWGP